MVVQDSLTVLNQTTNGLQDELYYYIWFEFLMNFDKSSIKEAYHKELERQRNAVDEDELRALGYSEEDIQKARF